MKLTSLIWCSVLFVSVALLSVGIAFKHAHQPDPVADGSAFSFSLSEVNLGSVPAKVWTPVVFKWKNNSQKAMYVRRPIITCGCLINTGISSDAVLPGQMGIVNVQFYPTMQKPASHFAVEMSDGSVVELSISTTPFADVIVQPAELRFNVIALSDKSTKSIALVKASNDKSKFEVTASARANSVTISISDISDRDTFASISVTPNCNSPGPFEDFIDITVKDDMGARSITVPVTGEVDR